MRTKTATVIAAVLLSWTVAAQSQAGAVTGKYRDHQSNDRDTQIVWSRFVDQNFSAARIVIAEADGGPVRELTQSSNGVQDIDPRISPDGRLVAFERDLPDGSAQIVLVGTDGRGEHVLDVGCTDPCAALITPRWAPDGRHILFTKVVGPFDQVNGSARSAVLYRTDRSGRHVARVSEAGIDGTFEDYDASFTSSGTLVFLRIRNADIHSAVFRREHRGSVQLTPFAMDADLSSVSPARSGPSKDLVVFETFGHGPPDGTSQAVATVPANCRPGPDCAAHIRFLTGQHIQPVQNFNPAWSPDGRRIVFVRFSFDPNAAIQVRGDIWTMRWDGSGKQPFSTSPLFEFRPAWGVEPDQD